MRTLAKTAVALSFIGATAIGTAATVQAQGLYFSFGYPHPYYHHYYYHDYYYHQFPRYYGYRGFGYPHPYYHHYYYHHYPRYYGYDDDE